MEIIELSGPIEATEDSSSENIIELSPASDVDVNDNVSETIDASETSETEVINDSDDTFLERFMSDLDVRGEQVKDIRKQTHSGEQSYGEGLFQMVGKPIAGTVLDFIGEGLVSAFRALPDFVEQPIREQAEALMKTETGRKGFSALADGMEAYEEFAKENPRAARNIDSVANVALLFVPPKGAGAAKSGAQQVGKGATILSKTAGVVDRAAAKQIAKRQKDVAQNLITPKQTAKIRADQVARESEQGILKSVVTEPSKQEARMIEEVAKLPGIRKNNTLRKNYRVVQEANKAEAESLKSALKANEIVFPRREFTARLDDTIKKLSDNPLIVGDAKASADKIARKMRQILAANKSTGSGLLKARKELDMWIKSQKGTGVFDPAKESALSIAVRDIRTTTNEFLAEKATNVAVKESLRKQSALYNAMENIAPKAADEGRNAIKRTIQRMTDVIPVSAGLKQTLASVGLVGAPLAIAPAETIAIAGTGFAAKKSFDMIRSPRTKQAISGLIKHTDKVINSGKLGPKALKDLRADRAALIEFSQILGEEDE